MKLVWLPLLELCLMNGMGHQGRIARGKPKENKLTFSSFINTKRSVDEMNEESFVFLRREGGIKIMKGLVMGRRPLCAAELHFMKENFHSAASALPFTFFNEEKTSPPFNNQL